MENGFTVFGKTAGPVRHQPLALCCPDGLAQVGLTRLAETALPAFRGIQGNDVIARLYAGNTRSCFLNDSTAFVAEDRRENTFGIFARQGKSVGVAHTGRHIANQHLTLAWTFDINFFNDQWLACFPGDCGSRFHGVPCWLSVMGK